MCSAFPYRHFPSTFKGFQLHISPFLTPNKEASQISTYALMCIQFLGGVRKLRNVLALQFVFKGFREGY